MEPGFPFPLPLPLFVLLMYSKDIITMNIKRLIHTPMGQIMLSMILGLGLASMFRHVCHGKNCIKFNGPVISEIDGKIYKFGDTCYQYKTKHVKCDAKKRVINIKDITKDEIF